MLSLIKDRSLEIKDLSSDFKDGVLLSFLIQAAAGTSFTLSRLASSILLLSAPTMLTSLFLSLRCPFHQAQRAPTWQGTH